MSLADISLYPLPTEGAPQHVVILRGMPASGKTTFARAHITAYPTGSVMRINNDELSTMFFGVPWGTGSASLLSESRFGLLKAALAQPEVKLIFLDNTNLRTRSVNRLATFIAALGAKVSVDDRFLSVPLPVCLERDQAREQPVGPKVLADMAQLAKQLKPWVTPSMPFSLEAFLSQIEPYENSSDLPSVMIVDIDGTLAHMVDRGPFDWDAVGNDLPNLPVVNFVKSQIASGRAVIVMSGREDVCRDLTQEWLDHHVAPGLPLFMRREDDDRKDSIVKHELFQAHIAGKYHVELIIDDRTSVVRLWRALGLVCWQVAEGDF